MDLSILRAHLLTCFQPAPSFTARRGFHIPGTVGPNSGIHITNYLKRESCDRCFSKIASGSTDCQFKDGHPCKFCDRSGIPCTWTSIAFLQCIPGGRGRDALCVRRKRDVRLFGFEGQTIPRFHETASLEIMESYARGEVVIGHEVEA